MTMGLNGDVTWVWPNMVNLNVMDFGKWYEWDGLWSEENEWDGLMIWKKLRWNVINEVVDKRGVEWGWVVMCYKPIIEQAVLKSFMFYIILD